MGKLFRHRKLWFAGALAVLIVAAVVVSEVTNTTHLFHKAAKVSAPSKPITHLNTNSSQKSQQSSSSSTSTNKNPATSTSSIPQGTAADNNGKTPAGVSNDPSQWSTSSSRLITLKSPLQNATLKPGDPIFGSAASGPVHYRLIDNQAGIISQGIISVVNGNFSASVNFKSYASSGRLDVFNTNASNGKETNEVQIPINF